MIDDGTRPILQQITALERAGVKARMGEVTDTDPLSVAVGGSDVSYVDVMALTSTGRLELNDIVLCLMLNGGNDLVILGRLGKGGGYQDAGPSGSDTGITSATPTALTGGPSLVVQESGAYEVIFGMNAQITAAGPGGLGIILAIAGAAQGTAPTVDRGYVVGVDTNEGGTCTHSIRRTLTAGQTLTLMRASYNGVAAAFTNGFIHIRPAR